MFPTNRLKDWLHAKPMPALNTVNRPDIVMQCPHSELLLAERQYKLQGIPDIQDCWATFRVMLADHKAPSGYAVFSTPGRGALFGDLMSAEVYLFLRQENWRQAAFVALRDLASLGKHIGLRCVVYRHSGINEPAVKMLRRANYYYGGRTDMEYWQRCYIVPGTEASKWLWFSGKEKP